MKTIEKIKQVLHKHFYIVENEDWYDADVIAEDLAKVIAVQNDVISNSRLQLPPIKKKARVKVCDTCDGNGQFLLANDTIRCRDCNGTGEQTY